jgi:hypothetical protein
MAQDFGSSITRVPQVPGAPRVQSPNRSRGGANFTLRGLNLPEEQEDARLARYQAFQQTVRDASYIEFICYEWLLRRGLVEGVDFVFRSPLFGGRGRLQGLEIDFEFPTRGLAWLVQGLQFHYVKPEQRTRDLIAKVRLASRGYIVVELFEDDIMQRAEYTLAHAIQGEQVSRGAP